MTPAIVRLLGQPFTLFAVNLASTIALFFIIVLLLLCKLLEHTLLTKICFCQTF